MVMLPVAVPNSPVPPQGVSWPLALLPSGVTWGFLPYLSHPCASNRAC